MHRYEETASPRRQFRAEFLIAVIIQRSDRIRRDNLIFEEFRKLISSVHCIAHRVGKLESDRSRPATKRSRRASESRSVTPPAQQRAPQQRSSTEKRRRRPSSIEMDWVSRDAENDRESNPNPTWSDSEEEDQPLPLSETNRSLLASAFSSPLSNIERRKIRSFSRPKRVSNTLPTLGRCISNFS